MSLVYSHPVVYELAMLALYGRHYRNRYRAVAELIPPGSSVLDLCCGPAVLYHRYLRGKSVAYTGWDIQPAFIAGLAGSGARGKVGDLRHREPFPPADYVVMQASLYHFLPDARGVVDRMFKAARRQVIIAEPVRNLAASGWRWLAWLARKGSSTAAGEHGLRFTVQTLDELLAPYRGRLVQAFLIPGGREKVYLFDK
jgi:SAM-dependent methyltransferase